LEDTGNSELLFRHTLLCEYLSTIVEAVGGSGTDGLVLVFCLCVKIHFAAVDARSDVFWSELQDVDIDKAGEAAEDEHVAYLLEPSRKEFFLDDL
jgi:hypothetical protein